MAAVSSRPHQRTPSAPASQVRQIEARTQRSAVQLLPAPVDFDGAGVGLVDHRHGALLPRLADLLVEIGEGEILPVIDIVA